VTGAAGPPPLTVVVVHRSQPARCATTVAALCDAAVQGVEASALVVDNGSSPADLALLRAGLPGVEVLELGANTGFGPGANAGLRRWMARPAAEAGEWVAVAPHDALPAPGCLGRLAAAASARPRAGLASADVGDGATPVVDRYFGAITRPAVVGEGWEAADHPHGTLLLARRACLEDVGLFDERYFAYGEEADLGLRARAAGWEVGVVRGADVRNPHLGGSLAVVDYLQVRNTLLLVREHGGRWPVTVRAAMALWSAAAGVTVRGRAGRPPVFDARARLLAVRDVALGRFGPPPPSLSGDGAGRSRPARPGPPAAGPSAGTTRPSPPRRRG
jgi:N-acetylglucosaminyl-diphospho-decaprenol L-rhamnosyltransferase